MKVINAVLLVGLLPFLGLVQGLSTNCKEKETCILYLQKKIQFLKDHFEQYSFRSEELSAIQLSRYMNHTYLDYTGSGLYQERQLNEYIEDLKSHRYGNAHSKNQSAQATDEKLAESRKMVLDFFNTDSSKYTIIYNSGATAALKMVGENFLWHKNSLFYYLRINHNSVIGIREYTTEYGAQFKALSENEISKILYERKRAKKENDVTNPVNCLFAFPAKDNFAGVLYPLEWIEEVKKYGLSDNCNWYVLIDIAAYAPSHNFDLSKHDSVDFAALSFYKMFGYPTGLGALLVKNQSSNALKKIYFGGGSVITVLCDSRICKRQNPDHFSHFEDGTLPFLQINALLVGLQIFREIPMEQITAHVRALTSYTHKELTEMRHSNMARVVKVYHMYDNPQDGIIAFNVFDKNGQYVPFFVFESMASAHNIHIRAGCFCNAGGCQDYLNLTNEEMMQSYENRTSCSDEGSKLKKPYGAIRASFGYMSTFWDAFTLIHFIRTNFVK